MCLVGTRDKGQERSKKIEEGKKEQERQNRTVLFKYQPPSPMSHVSCLIPLYRNKKR